MPYLFLDILGFVDRQKWYRKKSTRIQVIARYSNNGLENLGGLERISYWKRANYSRQYHFENQKKWIASTFYRISGKSLK